VIKKSGGCSDQLPVKQSSEWVVWLLRYIKCFLLSGEKYNLSIDYKQFNVASLSGCSQFQ